MRDIAPPGSPLQWSRSASGKQAELSELRCYVDDACSLSDPTVGEAQDEDPFGDHIVDRDVQVFAISSTSPVFTMSVRRSNLALLAATWSVDIRSSLRQVCR